MAYKIIEKAPCRRDTGRNGSIITAILDAAVTENIGGTGRPVVGLFRDIA